MLPLQLFIYLNKSEKETFFKTFLPCRLHSSLLKQKPRKISWMNGLFVFGFGFGFGSAHAVLVNTTSLKRFGKHCGKHSIGRLYRQFQWFEIFSFLFFSSPQSRKANTIQAIYVLKANLEGYSVQHIWESVWNRRKKSESKEKTYTKRTDAVF